LGLKATGSFWVNLGGGFGVQFKLPVSQKILTEVAKFDRFQGIWSAQQSIPAERLRRIREAAHVQSVASSCRLAGIRVSDAEVSGLLRGESVPLSDAGEILGYSHTLNRDLRGDGELLTGEQLQRLHAEMLGGGPSAAPSPWRERPLHREAFDADGRATGQMFVALPPRLVRDQTEKLTTWLEFELRTRERHPVLVIGAFVLCIFSIAPFERANGRLARVLCNLLLRRAGYGSVPYSSLETRMEELRGEYHAGISLSQTRLWTEDADLGPWLGFYLEMLGRHRQRVEAKMALEREVRDYPPLQRAILETVREHGSVDAALLLKATGANRNTLKDNLRRLVQRGVLEKTGQRRGTRYRMPVGDPIPATSASIDH
jgi:Fic family protein